MQPVHTSPLEPELGPTRGSATTDYVLHVTMLYPDLMTREWAPELGRQRVQPVRQDSVRAVGGRIQEMTRPEACLGATSRSVPAEVMVVAVSAADTSPRAPSKPARIPAKVAEEEQRLEVAWQTACSFTVRVIAKRLEAAPASTSSGASPEGAHDFSLVSNESP